MRIFLLHSLYRQEFKSLWPELDLIIDGGRIGEVNASAHEDEDSLRVSRAGSTIVDLSYCVRSPTCNKYAIVRDGR